MRRPSLKSTMPRIPIKLGIKRIRLELPKIKRISTLNPNKKFKI
jgi:hypothetical protein